MVRKRKRRLEEEAEEEVEDKGPSTRTARTIRLTSHENHRSHSQLTIFENVGSCGPAGRVWDAAIILSEYILNHFGEHGMKGMRVIELGSGTGLVGILCAKLGASVVLTDKCFALPLMQANAMENAADSMARGDITVQELLWGQKLSKSLLRDRMNLIVASDVVGCGDEALFPPLLKTLRQLCSPETTILMAYKPRARFERMFFDSVLESFCVSRVWNRLLPSDCYTETFSAPVDVFEIRLRTEKSSREGQPLPCSAAV
mmetsp:Transcript_24934/g.82144  ORF Transcript_24934/g.82144 Transcript_24934/m.82144 type:complete len:259 (-) Transcript_24934:2222-2998(-)